MEFGRHLCKAGHPNLGIVTHEIPGYPIPDTSVYHYLYNTNPVNMAQVHSNWSQTPITVIAQYTYNYYVLKYWVLINK